MIVTLILLAFASFGAGYATKKHFQLKQLHSRPEPPILETPEHVLSYLEACVDRHHPEMEELFGEFRLFINQKQLPSVSTVVKAKPDWYHSCDAKMAPEDFWNLFWEEMAIEDDQDQKIDVLKSWLDLNNRFTYKERQIILSQFDEQHRTKIRKIFVTYTYKKKKKKNG